MDSGVRRNPHVAATGDFAETAHTSPAEFTAASLRIPPMEPTVPPSHVGRFRIIELIGAGGMGQVFKAEDPTNGSIVAIKLLAPELANRSESLERFHKEARLLAEAHSQYIAKLIEIGEHQGIAYLAIEYVAGQSLAEFIENSGPVDESTALQIMCDVVRGLAIAHERGIVHRDIKPENILLVATSPGTQDSASPPTTAVGDREDRLIPPAAVPRVKLTDFGLARHVVESESLNLTKTGAIIGTPLYMAPEQCSGHGAIDARTDVYACGATLFHLLAGRPPFVADTALGLIALHCNEPPPGVESFNSAVSPGLSQVIERTLAKRPDERYASASQLLEDLERLARGEPTSINAHPRLPPCDPARIVEFNWTWQLDSTPEQLWPHVSNTERLNRAVGLQAPKFTMESTPNGAIKRIAHVRSAGMDITWNEHPFEWVEGRRFGVLREFSSGPFRWYTSLVELQPRVTGGTLLMHRLRVEPNGLLGRTAAAIEIGIRSKRALDRVYRRIDAAVAGRLGRGAAADPFESPAVLAPGRRARLERGLAALAGQGVDPNVVETLGDFLAQAPDQEVARIRPLALANRFGLAAESIVAACLRGARASLLVLLWDILCPICRIPSSVAATLSEIRQHSHCPACNLDFELDFANSVELIFRADPEIRDVELGVFCIGGPVHSPHVVAQARVAPCESLELSLGLADGTYRVRGPQLAFSVDFRVESSAAATQLELDLSRKPAFSSAPALRAGSQLLILSNRTQSELVVRIERTAARTDALTAARAASLAIFRELFPGEVLAPLQLINVATVTLLITSLADASRLYRELGDARAFAMIHQHFRLLADRIAREGGAVIKTIDEGVVASFHDSASAVRAGLSLQSAITSCSATNGLQLRVGIHRGPAMAATINDHLDYFGTTVRAAARVAAAAQPGELWVTADALDGTAADRADESDRPTTWHELELQDQLHPLRVARLRACRPPSSSQP